MMMKGWHMMIHVLFLISGLILLYLPIGEALKLRRSGEQDVAMSEMKLSEEAKTKTGSDLVRDQTKVIKGSFFSETTAGADILRTTIEVVPRFEVPSTFLYAVAAGYVACGMAAFLSWFALSSLLFGEHYAQLQPHRHPLWHTTFMAFVPNVMVPLLAWADIRDLFIDTTNPMTGWTAADFLLRPTTISMWSGTGFLLGFMLFDLTVFAIWSSDCLKSMGPLYYQYILHHLFSILCFPYALYTHRSVGFVAYFLATEISSAPLNIRFFMRECNADHGPKFMIVGAVMLVSYTLVRAVPSPGIWYLLATGSYTSLNWPQFLITMFCVPIPTLLNSYWYFQMLKGVYRMFWGKPAAGKDEMEAKLDSKDAQY